MVLTGIVADLLNSTRSIVEDVAYRVRRVELENAAARSAGDFGQSSGDRDGVSEQQLR